MYEEDRRGGGRGGERAGEKREEKEKDMVGGKKERGEQWWKKKDGRRKDGRRGCNEKRAGGSIQYRMYLCNQHKHNARINLQAVECVGDEVAIVGL